MKAGKDSPSVVRLTRPKPAAVLVAPKKADTVPRRRVAGGDDADWKQF
jgi:hypothetical protein